MDAISFVLGIKSSHLRSTHLRDLVYRGRVLKTSVINEDGSATADGANGQINGRANQENTQASTQERNDPKSAWVMAVYEDDAGDEQYWKRAITTQGVSEYRINNMLVTAQQYNEALEAENILIKARNFLVFQGDVEAIASQSPKDLTRLIEQISGSLEHKAEYERLQLAQEEAVENQNYNLNRRRGINSEIKQYQEQKREAESYARKVDERDQAIVTHVLWKLSQFQTLIEQSGADIQKHQEELKEHRRGIAKYEQSLEAAKKEQSTAGREVAKTERGIKSKERDIEEKENGIQPIIEKIHRTNDHLAKINSRISTISRERESKSGTVKSLAKDLKLVEKAESQWEGEWKRLSEKDSRALSDEDLQLYHKLKEDVNKRTSGEQIKADNLIRQQRADEETVNSLRSRVDATTSRISELEEELASINDNRNSATQLLGQTSKDIEKKKSEHRALTSERRRITQLRTELDEKLQAVLNKLVDAEDGRKQSDKELRLKATITDMKRIFPGVRGLVHELCQPKQRKFDIAVSTFLGRHAEAVVVDDEKTAKECIQFLREQDRGRATFIPLDTIQGTTIDSNLKGLHKGTRMAIDTINYNRALEPAMSYACGNAIVCDDLSIAKYVCYERGVEAKAVTLDGTIIHKGGLMTGGRGKEQNHKRWEDSEVDSLRTLADKLRNDLASLPGGRRNVTEEENLQSDIAGLNQKILYANEEIKALDRNLASKEKQLSHERSELSEIKPKYLEKQHELEQLGSNLKSFQDSISNVEDEIFREFCQRLQYDNIRVYEAQQGSLQHEGAQKRLEFKQQRSRLESRRNFEEQQLRETEERIQTLEVQRQRDSDLAEQLEAEREDITSKCDNLAAELEQLKERLERQTASYEKRVEKVAEERREVQRRSRNVDGTVREVARLEAEIQRSDSERYALLRRCKLEDIPIPLAANSNSLAELPIDGMLQQDADAMDVDDDVDAGMAQLVLERDFGIIVDFDDLDEDLKDVSNTDFTSSLCCFLTRSKNQDEGVEQELQQKIVSLEEELKQMAPNMRAIERLEGVESRLKVTEREFEDARRRAKKAKDDFQDVKTQRFELFNKAFSHISEQIGPIYQELTKSSSLKLGGQAYVCS